MAAEAAEKKEVIVSIEDGCVCRVVHPADIRVITRDYDVTHYADDQVVKTDEAGSYIEEKWGD